MLLLQGMLTKNCKSFKKIHFPNHNLFKNFQKSLGTFIIVHLSTKFVIKIKKIFIAYPNLTT